MDKRSDKFKLNGRVSFRIREDLEIKLNEVAQEDGKTVSAVAKEYLEGIMEEQAESKPKIAVTRKEQTPEMTVLDIPEMTVQKLEEQAKTVGIPVDQFILEMSQEMDKFMTAQGGKKGRGLAALLQDADPGDEQPESKLTKQ